MVYWFIGLWFMVYGLWFMVYGLWFMVYGLCFMVYGRIYVHNHVSLKLGSERLPPIGFGGDGGDPDRG